MQLKIYRIRRRKLSLTFVKAQVDSAVLLRHKKMALQRSKVNWMINHYDDSNRNKISLVAFMPKFKFKNKRNPFGLSQSGKKSLRLTLANEEQLRTKIYCYT